MRVLAVVCAMSVLGGCVTAEAPQAGAWKIERGYDRILGKPAGVALLNARSRNVRQQELRYPYDQLQLGSLQLTCFANAPVVRFEFNHRIGSNRTSRLSYRFDDNPGREAEARFLPPYKTVLIEDPGEVARFAEQLRKSSTLYVRVTSHLAGTSTVEFPLKGAALAIDAAYQSCPIELPSKSHSADARPDPLYFVPT